MPNNLTTVVANIWRKHHLLRNNDPRHAQIRLLLYIPGGGLRGVYAAGAVQALHELGLGDVFDQVVGVSTGSGVAVFFLGGPVSTRIGTSLYDEECCSGRYIRRWRFWHIVDNTYLEQQLRVAKPPNEAAVRACRTQLWFGMTDAQTGEGRFVNAKIAQPDLVSALMGSLHIPMNGDPLPLVNGRRCVDGDIALPLPLPELVDHFHPTDVLAIANHPQHLGPLGRLPVEAIAANTVLIRHPVRRFLLQRRQRYEDSLKQLARLSGVNIGVLYPPDCRIGNLTTKPDRLRTAVQGAMKNTIRLFEQHKPRSAS